jgi:hypothetical protein
VLVVLVEVVDDVEVVLVVVDVVVDVVEVVDAPDGHTVETPKTFKPAGTSAEREVPIGTLNTSPPTTWTRNTHGLAEAAAGSNATPVNSAATQPSRRTRVRCGGTS